MFSNGRSVKVLQILLVKTSLSMLSVHRQSGIMECALYFCKENQTEVSCSFSGLHQFWFVVSILFNKNFNSTLFNFRLLSAQRPVESVSSTSQTSQGIDRALYRIDTDIRRTGRIYLRDVEDIFSEIKTLSKCTSHDCSTFLYRKEDK